MKWRSATKDVLKIFDAVVPDDGSVERRKMFGYPCYFVGGNLAGGVHADTFILRLSAEDRETFLKLLSAHVFEPMAGRPMKEYVVVPQDLLHHQSELGRWIGRSIAYCLTLPPKHK